MFIKKLLPLFILLAVAFSISSNTLPEDSTLITYEGGSISQKDIESIIHYRLHPVRENEYNIRYEVSVRILKKELFQLEAKKRGISVEAFLDNYIKKNYRKPSEEIMKDYYEMYKDELAMTYKESLPIIQKELDLIQKKELIQECFKELVQKYNVKLKMKPVQPMRIQIDLEDDPWWGNPKAKVVVVEFSDFECKFCRKSQTPIRKIKKEYKDKIKWVFKDFPLSVHRASLKAHIAAACAREQGRYFDFHNRLYDHSPNLSDEIFFKIAHELKLDKKKFKSCLEDVDNKKLMEITSDVEYGRLIGLRGTPTLFINGKAFHGLLSYEQLKENIENELKNQPQK